MLLRKKGTTWSEDLLRHELAYSGIRHCRTRLDGAARPFPQTIDGDIAQAPPPAGRREESGQLASRA
ncbi:MAG: hypothetical protein ACM3Q1_04000 [Bacteroidales bacterium]